MAATTGHANAFSHIAVLGVPSMRSTQVNSAMTTDRHSIAHVNACLIAGSMNPPLLHHRAHPSNAGQRE